MVFISFLLLAVPGLISLRLFHRKRWRPKKTDAWMYISDYLFFSFFIVVFSYGVMTVSDPFRIVSFSSNRASDAITSIYSAGFIVKYAVASSIGSVAAVFARRAVSGAAGIITGFSFRRFWSLYKAESSRLKNDREAYCEKTDDDPLR